MAKYPGPLNDIHAGYQYMIEHADDLGIDPDKVVLHGLSSGSNLVLSLAHRLKHYGYKPRGCVTVGAFADHRPIFGTSTITGGCWDGRCQWLSSVEYLGTDNVSAFNNPEMYPNYAAPEDCIGLCPTFMHTNAEEASCASCEAYATTLSQAGVYNEVHRWGGTCHGCLHNDTDPDTDYGKRFLSIVDGNILDCIKYDLRRQWIADELSK